MCTAVLVPTAWTAGNGEDSGSSLDFSQEWGNTVTFENWQILSSWLSFLLIFSSALGQIRHVENSKKG